MHRMLVVPSWTRTGPGAFRLRLAGVAALATVTAIAAAGDAHAARPSADLVVSSISPSAGWQIAGATFSVADEVRNNGRSKATKSQTGYWLSIDKKKGRGDVLLSGSRKVKPLGPRKRSKGNAKVSVPGSTRLGAYHLLVCADAKSKVRERSEKNNCRVAKDQLAITPRPRPFTVQPILDDSRAVSQSVGSGGGTLVATASDGTTFTLTIPPQALVGEEQITMTPLASIRGFPFAGGFVGGVQLAPEGLGLLTPATLAIEPASPTTPAQRTGFAYYGSGSGFHLVPVGEQGGAQTISVRHFSGYGTGNAEPGDRSQFAREHPPSDPADQAEQQRAAEARQAELFAMAMAGYQQILGLIANRATIEQGLALLPVYESMSPRAAGLFVQLRTSDVPRTIRMHLANARMQCFARKDVSEAAWMIRMGTVAQLYAPDVLFDVAAAVERCVQFEFDMEMTARHNVQIDISTIGARVHGLPVRLASGFSPESLRGDAPIQVTSYHVEDFDCWRHTWNPQPQAHFEVRGIHFTNLNLRWAVPNQPPPHLAAVDVGIGSVRDEVTHTCEGDPDSSFTSVEGTYDNGMAFILQEGGGSSQRISGWTGGGSIFESSLRADGGNDSYTGGAGFTLRHTPQP